MATMPPNDEGVAGALTPSPSPARGRGERNEAGFDFFGKCWRLASCVKRADVIAVRLGGSMLVERMSCRPLCGPLMKAAA